MWRFHIVSWRFFLGLWVCCCPQILIISQAQYSPRSHDFCLQKVCEQTISGRHLPYPRILQILHSREYLNAVHIIPPSHVKGRRQKRQASSPAASAASEVVAHSMNNPLLMSIPFIVLSAMFLSSLRKRTAADATSYSIQPSPPPILPEIVHHHDLPLPLVPPHVPQPGQPSGGYKPDHLIHGKILSLVPYGLIPVAVFPAHFHYYGDASHHFPSECVIFSDDNKHFPVSQRRTYAKKRKKSSRRTRRNNASPYYYPTSQQLFGFRCLVKIIDKKSCNSAKECQRIKDFEAVYGHGYFFQDFTGEFECSYK